MTTRRALTVLAIEATLAWLVIRRVIPYARFLLRRADVAAVDTQFNQWETR